MYRIVGSPRTRAVRVAWMLEELEQPYEWDPAPPHSEAMIAARFDGKTPALVCEDGALSDSVAIATFLADRHQALTCPAGSYLRGVQDGHTQFCVDEIEGALWTSAKNRFVHPEERRTPAVAETCRYEFAKAMTSLERRLGDGPYLMGERFTVPDLITGHCALWAGIAQFETPGGPVGAYFERVLARPALARAKRRGAEALAKASAAAEAAE